MVWYGMGCGRSKSLKDEPVYHQEQDQDIYTKTDQKAAVSASSQNGSGRLSDSSHHSQTNGDLLGEEASSKASKDKANNSSTGPLCSNSTKITDSQLEFFRMLDEKIEKSRSYDSGLSKL